MKSKSWTKWFFFSLFLALLVAPAMAFGQDSSGPFSLAEDDMSRRTFIDPLFQSMWNDDPGAESPLGRIIGAFNAAILVIAGILVAYTIIAGAMSTAHDGEMMGKKWSAMWIPVRTALGVGAILPVVNGWCVAQLIVVWLAMQGAGLANTLWNEFIGPDMGSVMSGATYNPPMALSAVRQTYNTMIINSACVAAFQKEKNTSADDATMMGKEDYQIRVMPGADVYPTRKNNTLQIKYGVPTALYGSVSRCGEIKLVERLEDETLSGDLLSGDNTGTSRALNMEDIAQPVAAARWIEFRHAAEQASALGMRIASETPAEGYATLQEDVDATVQALLERYSENVGAAARQAFRRGIRQDFLAEIKRDGWIMAGAFYMQISKTQDLVTRSITNVPVAESPNLVQSRGGITGTVVDSLNSYRWLNVGSVKAKRTTELATELVSRSTSNSGALAGVASEAGTSGSADSKWATRLVNWFVNSDDTGIFNPAGGEKDPVDVNENPIIMAKNLGEKMTMTAWGALAAFTALTAGGAGGVGSSVAPIFSTMFLSLLLPGATLSTYLPMLPYILWLGVVLGWAILLIEAVIAAPLWALVHLAPDGDGVVGRGGQGYMLVLSLILRPPLMILGLVAAFVLMKPIGFLVNSTFVGAFELGVSPGFFGITQALAGCIIYAVLMIIIVQRVFSLIHVIPDRMLRWIGGGSGGELGQEAGALDQGSTAKVAAAFAAAHSLGNTMAQTAGAVAGDRRQNAKLMHEKGERAKLEQAGQLDGMRGAYVDDSQDAEMASYKAEAESDRTGAPSDTLEAQAAVAHGKAVSSASRLAQQEAAGDKSAAAQRFNEGLEAAKAKEAAGQLGAVDNFLDAEGQKAREASAGGATLHPFQDALLKRAEHKDRQAAHMAAADDVRAIRKEAADAKARADAQRRYAAEAREMSKGAGIEAKNQASASSHPAARAWMADDAAAKESGASRSAVAAKHTELAKQAQRNGEELQPFQQALIDREKHLEDARKAEIAAEHIENPRTSEDLVAEVHGAEDDPFADEGQPTPPQPPENLDS